MGEAKPMEWRDTSSYSRDDRERIPSSYTLALSPLLRIQVHRHIHYPKNFWLFSCFQLGLERVECGTDLEQAKSLAIQRVSERVLQHAASLGITPADPLKAELVAALKRLCDLEAREQASDEWHPSPSSDEWERAYENAAEVLYANDAALARAREGEKHG